jgi:hypothetical protein
MGCCPAWSAKDREIKSMRRSETQAAVVLTHDCRNSHADGSSVGPISNGDDDDVSAEHEISNVLRNGVEVVDMDSCSETNHDLNCSVFSSHCSSVTVTHVAPNDCQLQHHIPSAKSGAVLAAASEAAALCLGSTSSHGPNASPAPIAPATTTAAACNPFAMAFAAMRHEDGQGQW